MIVLDMEMSGISPLDNGIWQIGAFELENPKNTFLMEGRIDDDEDIHPSALKVIGKTESYLRDKKKMSQKELIKKFFEWTKSVKIKNLLGATINQDLDFLRTKTAKYKLYDINEPGEFPIPYRVFELHMVAQMKYYEINKEFLIKDDRSDMGLSNALKFCGMEDHRMKLNNGKIIKEGAPHNALEDCKLTAECFSRIVFGKNLLPEFKKFPIPKELLKNKEKD